MTYLEVARLVAEIVRAFDLAWPVVREVVVGTAPHMAPHLDDAIADFDRERAAALRRLG